MARIEQPEFRGLCDMFSLGKLKPSKWGFKINQKKAAALAKEERTTKVGGDPRQAAATGGGASSGDLPLLQRRGVRHGALRAGPVG